MGAHAPIATFRPREEPRLGRWHHLHGAELKAVANLPLSCFSLVPPRLHWPLPYWSRPRWGRFKDVVGRVLHPARPEASAGFGAPGRLTNDCTCGGAGAVFSVLLGQCRPILPMLCRRFRSVPLDRRISASSLSWSIRFLRPTGCRG